MALQSSSWIIDPVELHHQPAADHWRIVEVGSREQFQRGHIAGAIHLPWQALMHDGPPSPGLLPNLAQIEGLLNYLRHNSDCHYWVYDNEGGGWAGRFLWLLEAIGHPLKSYINGGKLGWQTEGLPLQKGDPVLPDNAIQGITVRIKETELISAEDLMRSFAAGELITIWDARSTGEYLGHIHTAQRNGHMPGAIHCEWTELMDPGNGYRIRNDSLSYLAAKGLITDQPVITHCQSHHRSGFTYLVGKVLGMNIRAYAGAWTEWGNRPDTPIILANAS